MLKSIIRRFHLSVLRFRWIFHDYPQNDLKKKLAWIFKWYFVAVVLKMISLQTSDPWFLCWQTQASHPTHPTHTAVATCLQCSIVQSVPYCIVCALTRKIHLYEFNFCFSLCVQLGSHITNLIEWTIPIWISAIISFSIKSILQKKESSSVDFLY